MTLPRAAIDAVLAKERLDPSYVEMVEGPLTRLAADVAAAQAERDRTLVFGLCGAQGSGKSTIARFLSLLLEAQGLRVATLSLDDLYLTRDARAELAARVHPLLAVRGVPGTHDVGLGRATLQALAHADPDDETRLPRFDKATDTRAPDAAARVFRGRADVVVFEGWCVGARPQADADLEPPLNALERERDAEGVWRRWVNAALAGPYQELFAAIDMLALLEAPDFAHVLAWRGEQEAKLRDCAASESGAGAQPLRVMSEAELAEFVMHYERLTRHILAEMPQRCDVRLTLDAERRITDVATRSKQP